jgi:hypothetical protein
MRSTAGLVVSGINTNCGALTASRTALDFVAVEELIRKHVEPVGAIETRMWHVALAPIREASLSPN